MTHISEAEAAKNLSAILDRVHVGEKFVIERNQERFMLVPQVPGGKNR